jgi:hypothetical protein
MNGDIYIELYDAIKLFKIEAEIPPQLFLMQNVIVVEIQQEEERAPLPDDIMDLI